MTAVRTALLLTLVCLISTETLARPISYTGGWTLIGESDRQSSAVLMHHTPAHQWSIGPRIEVNRDTDFALYSIQPTWLAKRWFGSDYQGNLYFFGGAGIASGKNGNPLDDRIAGYGGLMADWGSRWSQRIYRRERASIRTPAISLWWQRIQTAPLLKCRL